MSSITIHNLDEDLEQAIRRAAKEEHTSLNKVIKSTLRKSFGLSTEARERLDLSEFSGTWTKADAQEFEENTQDFNKIDKEIWK